jgi:predicted DsbA family dithiol-disulfide isomerase
MAEYKRYKETNLGIQVGLDGIEIETVLHSDTYATAVKKTSKWHKT